MEVFPALLYMLNKYMITLLVIVLNLRNDSKTITEKYLSISHSSSKGALQIITWIKLFKAHGEIIVTQ